MVDCDPHHDRDRGSRAPNGIAQSLAGSWEQLGDRSQMPVTDQTGPDWIGLPSSAPAGQKNGSVEFFRTLQKARRLRSSFFKDDLFSDPAWDIMIDLYIAGMEHTRISVSSACIAADAPATTALRHLKVLANAGVVIRTADRHDARRVIVRLSPEAHQAMADWFHHTGFS